MSNSLETNTIWKSDQYNGLTYYVIITELFTGEDRRNYVKYKNLTLGADTVSTMGVSTFKEWFNHVG
jgi:hypothetical protein